jgi:hypothetical protein
MRPAEKPPVGSENKPVEGTSGQPGAGSAALPSGQNSPLSDAVRDNPLLDLDRYGYWSPEQVAQLLQVSTKTVYRLAAANPDLPRLPLPGVLRFPRQRLLRWLRDREEGRRTDHPTLRNFMSAKTKGGLVA